MVGLLVVTSVMTVTFFSTSFSASIDDMSSSSKSTAKKLVNQLLKERVDLTVSRLSNEFVLPPMQLVTFGQTISGIRQSDFRSKLELFELGRMLMSIVKHYPLLSEAWVCTYENGSMLHAIKGFLSTSSASGYLMKYSLGANNSQITYNDRIPLPEMDKDYVGEAVLGRAQRFIDDEFLDENFDIARKWTTPQTDPEGVLEIGFGTHMFPGRHAFDNVWILTEFSMASIRPLLQSMVAGMERYTEDTYDDPGYAPHTNESVLCLAEVKTGLIVQCTHGFSAVLTDPTEVAKGADKWTRSVATDSPHPVVGPAFQALQRSYGSLAGIDHDGLVEFESVGTARYPIAPTKFFLRSAPISEEGLEWVVVAITPYNSIMKEVDDNTEEAEDDASRAIMISIVLAVVIVILAILVVIAFTYMFTKPILELRRSMMQVEDMDLESIDTDPKASFFTEIYSMNNSFIAMVKMLAQYKCYLPSHLQGGDSEQEPETDLSATEVKSGSRSVISSVHSRSMHSRIESSMRSKRSSEHTKAHSLFSLELNDRQACTVLTVHFRNADSLSHNSAQAAFNGALDEISKRQLTVRARPNITVSNNTVQLIFNTALLCPSHPRKALSFAFAMKALQTVSKVVATSGKVISGNVGSQQQRFHLVMGFPLQKQDVMNRYIDSFEGTGVFCDDTILSNCPNFVSRRVHQLCTTKTTGGVHGFGVFEVLEEEIDSNQEWMYSLERNNDPRAILNSAFDLLMQGKFLEAKTKLSAMKETPNGEKEANVFTKLMDDHPECDGQAKWLAGLSEKSQYEVITRAISE